MCQKFSVKNCKKWFRGCENRRKGRGGGGIQIEKRGVRLPCFVSLFDFSKSRQFSFQTKKKRTLFDATGRKPLFLFGFFCLCRNPTRRRNKRSFPAPQKKRDTRRSSLLAPLPLCVRPSLLLFFAFFFFISTDVPAISTLAPCSGFSSTCPPPAASKSSSSTRPTASTRPSYPFPSIAPGSG